MARWGSGRLTISLSTWVNIEKVDYFLTDKRCTSALNPADLTLVCLFAQLEHLVHAMSMLVANRTSMSAQRPHLNLSQLWMSP